METLHRRGWKGEQLLHIYFLLTTHKCNHNFRNDKVRHNRLPSIQALLKSIRPLRLTLLIDGALPDSIRPFVDILSAVFLCIARYVSDKDDHQPIRHSNEISTDSNDRLGAVRLSAITAI